MRVALVTGGGRGIGRAIVESLAAEGYAVAFTYARSKEAADELVRTLAERDQRAIGYKADVRDHERTVQVVESVTNDLGPIDVLVNNAGIRKDGLLLRMPPQDWKDVLDTNLTGAYSYCQAVLKGMLRRGGSIINITSVSAFGGNPGQTAYSAAKAGLIGLTKTLARETARFNVRVNAIAPGYIETDMTASLKAATREKAFAQIPLGRAGTAQEVARMAVYLASEEAAYVTGQTMTIDGGLT